MLRALRYVGLPAAVRMAMRSQAGVTYGAAISPGGRHGTLAFWKTEILAALTPPATAPGQLPRFPDSQLPRVLH